MGRRPQPLNPDLKDDWRERFLVALAHIGVIKYAAKAVGIGYRTAYDERNRNPEFAARWDEIIAHEAVDTLEQEAWRRAVEGVDEPITGRGGVVMVKETVTDPETGKEATVDRPLTVRKYSDTLLIFLLKAKKPHMFRDNYRAPVPQPPADLDLNADIALMGDKEREVYKLRLEQYLATVRASGAV